MSNKITPEVVRHIGKLARIELDDPQVEMLGRQLGDILSYVDKLQALNTDGVAPMAHAVEIHNVLADDAPGQSLTADEALANAPARDNDFFMVPKVLGDS